MRTTNYEISKKLWEINFKANFDYVWDDKDKLIKGEQLNSQFYGTKKGLEEIIIKSQTWFPAYDLETILEALPDIIYSSDDFGLKKNEIGYYYFDYDHVAHGLYIEKEKDESLADTAARLLLLLVEKEIIKF
jgi:hypothetical protein